MTDYAYRRLFEEFMADTNDGFIIVDPSGVVLDINQNYCNFFGKTREETGRTASICTRIWALIPACV